MERLESIVMLGRTVHITTRDHMDNLTTIALDATVIRYETNNHLTLTIDTFPAQVIDQGPSTMREGTPWGR